MKFAALTFERIHAAAHIADWRPCDQHRYSSNLGEMHDCPNCETPKGMNKERGSGHITTDEAIWKVCPECDGTGNLLTDSVEIACPACLEPANSLEER